MRQRFPIGWVVLLLLTRTPQFTLSSPPICSLEVVNPTCNNGTQLPTDEDFPCLTEEFCLNATFSGVVDCAAFICSLRLNCACFAGEITSCASNSTTCTKDGCSLVVDMFEQTPGCYYETYFGPRNSSEMFSMYLDQCLEGCNNSISTQSSRYLSILIALIILCFAIS